jgi:uncharacterized protein (DUF1697 family)
MPRYVALLRGINVGPHKRIAMTELKALVEGLGHTEVKTYVTSGNVVFSTAEPRSDVALPREIEAAIMARCNLDVPVIVRSGEDMARIVAGNPFPQHEDQPKTLHVSFLSGVPAPDRVAALADAERGRDDYRVIGQEVYLHYPNGMSGAVFMVNGLDRALGVTATSRNWRTVLKLAGMAGGPAESVR